MKLSPKITAPAAKAPAPTPAANAGPGRTYPGPAAAAGLPDDEDDGMSMKFSDLGRNVGSSGGGFDGPLRWISPEPAAPSVNDLISGWLSLLVFNTIPPTSPVEEEEEEGYTDGYIDKPMRLVGVFPPQLKAPNFFFFRPHRTPPLITILSQKLLQHNRRRPLKLLPQENGLSAVNFDMQSRRGILNAGIIERGRKLCSPDRVVCS